MSPPAATGCYVGLRAVTGALVTRPDGSPLELAPSLAVWRHSPTGFEWGFPGIRTGPARPGAAARRSGHGPTPLPALQGDVVARWRGKEWKLEPRAIDAWRAVATA